MIYYKPENRNLFAYDDLDSGLTLEYDKKAWKLAKIGYLGMQSFGENIERLTEAEAMSLTNHNSPKSVINKIDDFLRS